MSSTTVLISTDSDGEFTFERPMFAWVRAILVDIGTLETPDISVTDGVHGTEILTLTGATSDVYPPAAAFSPVLGTLKVEVTGGGVEKHGRVRFLLET